MKKKLLLITTITSLFSVTMVKSETINKATKADTEPTFLVAPKIAKGDEVIFANLECSTSAITGGYSLAIDNEKGYTSKAVSFSGMNVNPNSDNTFSVVEGYQSGTFAFKLGDKYLRADNSTTKFVKDEPLSATASEDGDCSIIYPYNYNGTTIDFEIFFFTDGTDWMVSGINGCNGSDGQIMWYESGMDITGDSFTIDSLVYYKYNPGVEIPTASLTLSCTINGSTISIPNPNQQVETVDQEASWTYEYDKTLGVSYVVSSLNNKYLYYDDVAGKFKMSDSAHGIDVFYNTSLNTSIHTPVSITINTDSLSSEVTQGNAWSWTSVEVTATYAGGAFTTLPIGGFDVSLPDTSNVGKQTFKVSLYNLEKTFEVTINAKPVADVKITGLSFANYKTEYCVGDEFDYDVDITVHYSGKEDYLLTEEDKERVTFQIPNLSRTGYNRAVQVGYWEIINDKKVEIKIGAGANYYVNIVDIDYTIDSITASLKEGVTLYNGDIFDLNNVAVMGTFKALNHNDKTEAVKGFTVTSTFDLSTAMSEGTYEFNVSYIEDGKTVTTSFTATVEHKPVVVGYEVEAEDGFVGSSYDVNNSVKVLRVYDTGAKEAAENINVNINDLNAIGNSKVPGQQTIRINADGKEIETKTINLVFAPVDSFSLKYESSKEDAKIGDSQQLYIKKVNSEPTLANDDWMSPLTDRSEKYLSRFNFTSKDTSIATVDEKGFVRYVGNGMTEIEVAPKSGDAEPFNYSVVVGGPFPSNFVFSSENVKVKIGEDVVLGCTIYPNNANLVGVSWRSSDESVATVDEDGKVHGVADGVAVITVSDSFSGKSANCGVIVKKAFPTKVTLSETTKNLVVGDEYTIVAAVEPKQDVNQSVTFSSSNENVATVDANGKVKAIGKGTALINVKCAEDNTISATLSVTVAEPIIKATSLTLDKNTVTLKVGETSQITATIAPNDTTDKTITYSSANINVATVDANGKVTAVAEGTATIYVSCASNASLTQTFVVTVENSNQENGGNENNNDSEEGCCGSIVTSCALIASLSFLSIAIILFKKKSEIV